MSRETLSIRMTANEKILGLETIKARIAVYMKDKKERQGMTPQVFEYEVNPPTTQKQIISFWRGIPEGFTQKTLAGLEEYNRRYANELYSDNA